MRIKSFCRLTSILILLVSITNVMAASIDDMASQSANGLGVVMQSAQGKKGQVILFEENHASLSGQIEIAHMLVRLYKNYGLRNIALEGAVPSQNLTPDWAGLMDAGQRLNVSARLLGDGELSSAEFMAAAFHDVVVAGMDDENAYKVELDAQASSSSHFYLLLIAESSFTSSQAEKINKLFAEKKVKEAFDVAINADPWTKQMYKQLFDNSKVVSTEATLELLEQIEEKARSKGITVPPEIAKGMEAKKAFFRAAGLRSDTMVSIIANISSRNPQKPIAAIIGAAHTERMANLLKSKSITFAVIRPNALDKRGVSDGIAIDYERKLQGLSVDRNGLGALLDGHRKPPPVITTQWLSNKANIYYTTDRIVQKVLVEAEPPPYDDLDLPKGIYVDAKNIARIGDEVIFSIQVETGTSRETIWVRAAYSDNIVNAEKSPDNVENRIKALLAEAGGGGSKEPPSDTSKQTSDSGKRKGKGDGKGNKDGGPKKPRSNTRQVTDGIFAKFSKNRSEIEKESVLVGASS